MGQQRDEVLTRLRQLITHGHYVPGRLFSENDLIKELGVSRSPIREALAVLAQEGIVEQLHRKGVMVRVIGEPETREVLQLRRSLEQVVVNRLATSTNPDRLEGIEAILEEMDKAAAANDAARFLDADTEFHCGLARRAGYGPAADMLRTLRDKVRIVGLDSLQQNSDFTGANETHRALVQAIADNDVPGAQRILKAHLDATSRLLVRELRSESDAETHDIRELVEQARRYRRHEGRIRDSIELLEAAADLARESDDLHHYLVQVLLELAATRRSLRDFGTAEKHAQEALSIALAHRNRAGQAWANSELGRIAVETQRGDVSRLDRASELFTGLNERDDERQRGWNYYSLALRASAQNDLVEAGSQAASALEVLTRVQDDYGRAKALELLGRVAARRQDVVEAQQLLSEARELAELGKYMPLIATTTLEEGRLLRSAGGGGASAAEAKFRTAFELFRRMKDGQGMSDALGEMRQETTPSSLK